MFSLLVKVLPATVCTSLKIDEDVDRHRNKMSMQQILRRDTTKHTKMASEALSRAVRLKTWK